MNRIAKLIRFNMIMGAIHAVQGLIVLLIGNDFTLPVTTGYLSFNESSQSLESASRVLFELPFAPLIALFFFLSAGFHFYLATRGKNTYTKQLSNGMNKFRWYEYSISASIMMVAIAMLAGVYELSLLIAIFGLTSVMNLTGLVMEVHNQTTKRTNWLSYYIGCLAGILPWIIVAIYFWGSASSSGAASIPTFVYWIYVSIFLFFNAFAINMILQYKQVGKWKDYLYGERAYIILSLVAKSLLAWQVFAGALQPA